MYNKNNSKLWNSFCIVNLETYIKLKTDCVSNLYSLWHYSRASCCWPCWGWAGRGPGCLRLSPRSRTSSRSPRSSASASSPSPTSRGCAQGLECHSPRTPRPRRRTPGSASSLTTPSYPSRGVFRWEDSGDPVVCHDQWGRVSMRCAGVLLGGNQRFSI